MHRIFYSWQSTTPGPLNCDLIRDSLDAAVNRLPRPADVDEATRNVSGSRPIFETILGKIRGSGVFVADLTLVRLAGRTKKFSCNPNVLVEYGYALVKPGEERIVSIMNTHYGSPERLPFDLRHRRVNVVYDLGPNATAEDRERTKNEVTDCLLRELRLVLEDPASELSLSPSAVRIAKYFVEGSDDRAAHSGVGQRDLAGIVGLEETEAFRAVAELASRGYLDRALVAGTTTPPVRPQPKLFWDLDPYFMSWDPRDDARTIAEALVRTSDTGDGWLSTPEFAVERGWPLRRLNSALRYLVTSSIVNSSGETAPDLVTHHLRENDLTRQFAEGRFNPETRRRS